MSPSLSHNSSPAPSEWHGVKGLCIGYVYPALAEDGAMNSMPFPWQLHFMLESAAKGGFDHIVSWLHDDKSFKVHKPNLFVTEVMPRFFNRQTKYKSFQRQLNIWNFERLIGSRGPCNGGYYHTHFQRHDTSSLCFMKRRDGEMHSERTASRHDFEFNACEPQASLFSMVTRSPRELSSGETDREPQKLQWALKQGECEEAEPIFLEEEIAMISRDTNKPPSNSPQQTSSYVVQSFPSQPHVAIPTGPTLDESKYVQIGLQMAWRGSFSIS